MCYLFVFHLLHAVNCVLTQKKTVDLRKFFVVVLLAKTAEKTEFYFGVKMM